MALKNNFYNEIFSKEKKWIELINSGLMNPIYCNLELRSFYLEKKHEIEEEYKVTNNQMLSQVLIVIQDIIKNIDLIVNEYNNNGTYDTKILLPIFLTNQMNNVNQPCDKKEQEVEESEELEENYYLYEE